MIIIRSVVFNVLFYLVLAAYLMVAMPTLLLPRWGIIRLAQHWGRVNLHLLRIVCGITVEWRGLEKIPAGACLVAAKHQSVWETFAWRARMIPVDRGGGKPALAAMAAHVRDALAAGKQIIIFPEGTRRPAGAEPKYKYGIAHLYGEGIAACVPIALNSGLFWPRRQFLRYPGTITVEILDPIAPGLPIEVFFERLQRDLEAATARLIAQGRRDIAAAGAGPAAV